MNPVARQRFLRIGLEAEVNPVNAAIDVRNRFPRLMKRDRCAEPERPGIEVHVAPFERAHRPEPPARAVGEAGCVLQIGRELRAHGDELGRLAELLSRLAG
jgi:hypothetical protein